MSRKTHLPFRYPNACGSCCKRDGIIFFACRAFFGVLPVGFFIRNPATPLARKKRVHEKTCFLVTPKCRATSSADFLSARKSMPDAARYSRLSFVFDIKLRNDFSSLSDKIGR